MNETRSELDAMIASKMAQREKLDAQLEVLIELRGRTGEPESPPTESRRKPATSRKSTPAQVLQPGSLAHRTYGFLKSSGGPRNAHDIAAGIGVEATDRVLVSLNSAILRHVRRKRIFLKLAAGFYGLKGRDEGAGR